MRNLLNLLVISVITFAGFGQKNDGTLHQIDSLKKIIESASHDSVVVKALVKWDDLIYQDNPKLDLQLNLSIDSIASANLVKKISAQEQNFFLNQKSFATGNLGLIYNALGDNTKALEYLFQAVEIRKQLNNEKAIAYAFNNIGAIYNEQGLHNKAIEYYTKSLVIHEKINNYRGIGGALNNIALIHKSQGNYESAISFYEKSIAVKIDNQDTIAIAVAYLNIGALYVTLEEFNKAHNYFKNSLELSTAKKDSGNISRAFVNMGTVYQHQDKLDSALIYYLKGYQIQTKGNDLKVIAETTYFLGSIYFDLGELGTAEEYSKKALNLSFENDVLKVSELSSELLYRIYKQKDQPKKSLEMLELNIELKDSINNEKNQKAVIQQQFKYKYEKKITADSVKALEESKIQEALLTAEKAETQKQKAQVEKQEQEKYFLFGILSLAILLGGFIFNRFRVTRNQKAIIEEQKEKVDAAFDALEEKSKEIADSINYAKRIQSAILPPNKVVKEYLQNSFILYKPKDVVAGDFYWMEHSAEKVFFAAADCTGHGVPGAMVSVVCNNALNRSVREYGMNTPGSILDKTKELVIKEFEKSEEEVKDGMDIALCCLEGDKLTYAGAHNPLWIIRNNEIIEVKGDKQPIGKFEFAQQFTTHEINLKKGDTIYIFSDGYPDQFGGDKGKKFKTGNLKKLLLSIQSHSMERQKEILNDEFEKWRGAIEQIDDVCIMGVRI